MSREAVLKAALTSRDGAKKLEDMIASLSRTSIEDWMKEIEEVSGLPEYEKSRQLKGLARTLSSFAVKRRRIGLSGVQTDDGRVVDDDEACSALGDHWPPLGTLGASHKMTKKHEPRSAAAITK